MRFFCKIYDELSQDVLGSIYSMIFKWSSQVFIPRAIVVAWIFYLFLGICDIQIENLWFFENFNFNVCRNKFKIPVLIPELAKIEVNSKILVNKICINYRVREWLKILNFKLSSTITEHKVQHQTVALSFSLPNLWLVDHMSGNFGQYGNESLVCFRSRSSDGCVLS